MDLELSDKLALVTGSSAGIVTIGPRTYNNRRRSHEHALH